ncbi:DUF222 domain-containing protein [Microbacterium horticulturae]|uniref:DUF222 domain-containing protein n=1 Tax=Microbacterium horticulturae TaxID=3028316 RepID=A0ABY8BV84_9MICO|nr:HNH endonuclease signature motif containing protein [Microbacterium sp. KACC 23027]WEG07805.1 DUF222 domain-containing protein [Microbacterium sp. KACC 23027]
MSALMGVSPVLAEVDELLDSLVSSREAAGRAFAAEMFFFARVADLVQRREAERGARTDRAVVDASQLAMRELFAEIAAGLRLSEWQVARKVSQASTLVGLFYETLCDASGGEFSGEHAVLIAEAGVVIDDAVVRAQFEAVARDMAREMTPAQLKAALSGLVVRLDPEGTQQRVREAVARRKVSVREVEPGLARITADVPVAEGVGAVGRLREAAAVLFGQNQAEKTAHEATTTAAADSAGAEPADIATDADAKTGDAASGAEAGAQADDFDAGGGAGSDADAGDSAGPVFDDRSVAQIMADMFCDLLLTAPFAGHGATDDARDALSAIRPQVQVTIPAETLTGARVGGAMVDGIGPVGDDTARRLAGGAGMWSRVFTDPATGVPVCVDRYRPSKRQKRFLQARDQQCRFPGCRRRAVKCDIDHTVPHAAGGPTCLCNLEHFCKRHHTVKHDTAWDVEQRAGGVLIFTAPTKRTYATRPPGTVRFEPVALIDPDPHDQHMIATQYANDPAPF